MYVGKFRYNSQCLLAEAIVNDVWMVSTRCFVVVHHSYIFVRRSTGTLAVLLVDVVLCVFSSFFSLRAIYHILCSPPDDFLIYLIH